MLIIKPYEHIGKYCDGVLFGSGDAARRSISNATFLCSPDSDYGMKPEDYRFFKIIDNQAIEVPQTRLFYSGKRRIDSKYYVKKEGYIPRRWETINNTRWYI